MNMEYSPEGLALQAADDRYYELGRRLREHGPDLIQAAQDPAALTLGAAGLVGLAAVGVAAPRLAGAGYCAGWRYLFTEPGGLLLGRAPAWAGFTHPVTLARGDRLNTHNQLIAPTAGGKTTFLEWMFHQDLASGFTTASIENRGDFGQRAATRALLSGRPVHLFDPTVKNTLKWNPLSGEPEWVAETMVSTFESSAKSGKEEFFKDFNGTLLRHVVLALKGHEAVLGREIDMLDVWDFLNDPLKRREVLNTSGKPGGKGRVRVTAPHLPEMTRKFFEGRYFGSWTHKQREEFTASLFSCIDGLLGPSVARRALCPRPGEPTLDLQAAISSGGFLWLSVPERILQPTSTRTLSTWLLLALISAVRKRGRGGRPISLVIDEAASLLGHASSDAARVFGDFLTESRHYHALITVSCQSYSLMPRELEANLQTNARNRFIAGGLGPEDTEKGLAIMGKAEEEVTDRRRNFRGLLSFPGSYSVGSRTMERPILTENELRRLPLGMWYARLVKHRRDQLPILFKSYRAPSFPGLFEPERIETDEEQEGFAAEPDRRGTRSAGPEGVVG
jgi:hypothetical protein